MDAVTNERLPLWIVGAIGGSIIVLLLTISMVILVYRQRSRNNMMEGEENVVQLAHPTVKRFYFPRLIGLTFNRKMHIAPHLLVLLQPTIV